MANFVHTYVHVPLHEMPVFESPYMPTPSHAPEFTPPFTWLMCALLCLYIFILRAVTVVPHTVTDGNFPPNGPAWLGLCVG